MAQAQVDPALDQAQLVGQRVVLAQQTLETRVAAGMRFWRYIFGDPPLPQDVAARQEYFTRYGWDADDEKIKQGWMNTMAPLHSVLRGTVIPFLTGGKAKWFNERREHAEELEYARNELYALISNLIWKKCDAKEGLVRALDDAFWCGRGWMETDSDDKTGLPRHQWRDVRHVLWDTETQSPRHEDMRWMGVKMLLPIETADYLAREKWDAKSYDFNPIQYLPELQSDSSYAGFEVVPGARRSDRTGNIARPTKFVRLVRIYVKGENPFADTARLGSRAMNDPAGHDNMYDGKDHVLIVEASGGWQIPTDYKIVARIDWPFPCDPGETPLTPYSLTRDNRSFMPAPLPQASQSLQAMTNKALTDYATDIHSSARRWGGVQPEAFQNEADAQAVTEGEVANIMVMLKKGYTVKQAIEMGNFGVPNPALKDADERGRELYRLISGLQSFEVEVRANQTKYNTQVQNDQSQLKLHSLAELVVEPAKKMQRKGLMCARATMSYGDVRKWVIPPRNQQGQVYEVNQPTSDDKGVWTSPLWPNKPDWRDIRDEVEIDLEMRSMQFKNPDLEAAEFKEIADYQMGLMRIIGDTAKGGNPQLAMAQAVAMNNTIRRLCKLKNIQNFEEFLIDPQLVGTPPPPPPAPPPEQPKVNISLRGELSPEVALAEAAGTPLPPVPADPQPKPVPGAQSGSKPAPKG